MLFKLLSILSFITLVSCGGNNEQKSPTGPSAEYSIRFYDSKVSGLLAQGDYGTYTTNSNGYINCVENEMLIWTLAGIELGMSICNSTQSTVYPTTLTNGDLRDDWTTNIGVLLISLDTNSNPADGISLPDLSQYNLSSINADLYDNTDSNSNGTNDEMEYVLQEINSKSGISFNLVSNASVQTHFEISFGTNATISKTFTNNLEAAGAGTCPTNFTVVIQDDTLGFEITSGSFPLDLNQFQQISTSRNLSNNGFDISYESNESSLDSGSCVDNGGFLKIELLIDGNVNF